MECPLKIPCCPGCLPVAAGRVATVHGPATSLERYAQPEHSAVGLGKSGQAADPINIPSGNQT